MSALEQIRAYLLKRKETLADEQCYAEMGGLQHQEVVNALAVITAVAPEHKTYFIRFWQPELRALWAKEFPEFPLSTSEDSSVALTKEQLGDIAQRCLDLKLFIGAGYGDCIFIARNFFKTT